ncbi:TadE/TadG family type IV pilus assembly protein [Brevundimonas sp. Root1279]|uniref:TadE/TadG family type IV pilus assembly protein n=1 Tax=Brevundimonas sp. Root1279 TaxID=1736443 RepID=UPI000B0A2DE5|nr:TadE/TadG family type IV pilus assembly protein [Brevundimonas sp. Root1279]
MAGRVSWPGAGARRRLRRFAGDQDGSTLVEFAFVIFPFFFMVFAILEVALIFTVNSVLENATIETGRLVRTGQARAADMGAVEFENSLCSRMSIFAGECPDRVSIDVRVIPQFKAVPPDPTSGGAFDPSGLSYANGLPGDLILVRVWYKHPLVTAFMSPALSRMSDGTALLTSTTAFRNEPP